MGVGADGLAIVAVLLVWSAATIRQRVLTIAWTWLDLTAALFLAFVLVQQVRHLSLDPAGTSEAVLKLAMCLLVFFLTRQLFYLASVEGWNGFGFCVLLYASAMGLFAIIEFFTMPGSVFGLAQFPDSAFGTYVNRDHFAGLMEMLMPIAGAYYMAVGRKGRLSLLWGCGLAIAVVALLLTGSRGGFLAFAGEVFLLLTVIAVRTRAQRRGLLLAAVAVFLMGAAWFVLFLAPPGLSSRFASVAHFRDSSVNGNRLEAAEDTFRMFAQHPVTGAGLGSFEAVYPQVQSFVSEKTWPYAHNDYVELLAETGVIGGAIALAALAIFLYQSVWLGFRRRLLGSAAWIQLGATIGCCGLLIHSAADFNLRIPANAAWFAACAALATMPARAADTNPSSHHSRD